ncbi:hypothetical protein OCC_14225 [Thermococcus litoralis DSM 5473]|uniref:DUF2357 domain-containing protein n=1 Tax=Thermococcus litoralis (strain ATCC 51850 / DSM 5473 / JCM 8560 / NS-C) TaxID=523849 RepID=S5Z4Y4_THELN|nr:DUF2357 domain-containing protein [Thermococcus litoralis]AGT34325.1 hypothetical protein OCC_14225 [Thermococcus litoralis DSM 5473]
MENSEAKNVLLKIPLDKDGKYQLKGKIGVINDTVYLFEWQEYRVIGKREFSIRIGNEKTKAEEINENTYLATFQFKNYIGKTNIEILENGKEVSLRFKNFEVLSEKVGKIYNVSPENTEELVRKHEELYNALVKYISEKSILLPFSITAPTGFGVEESEEPISELFVYHFLVNNRERIISAYEEIIKSPHRKLVEKQEWLNFWEVSEANEDTAISIISHPEYLTKAEDSSFAVAESLSGYVPTKVAQEIKYESFDTHENRFVKHFLNELIAWGERTLNAIMTSSYLTKDQKQEAISKLKMVLGDLEYYAVSDIFDDVSEMIIFPSTSQVLLKREGYRDLLQLWWEFKAYSPFFGEMKRAIANKDIAKLYEYWCFFKLVEELGDILENKRLKIHVTPTGELSERGDVYAEFDNGWRLYYNKRLIPRKWSYSVTLRPDFSLFMENAKNAGLIGVFDAKFKLDVVDEEWEIEEFDEEVEVAEKTGEYETWAKLEDIYKMHTYRDALGARFALVLYPGSRSKMYLAKIDKEKTRNQAFVNLTDVQRLLKLVVLGLVEGVGYLGFIPG